MSVRVDLVGRVEELALLEQTLDELDRGGARAVELIGEPGIGKTRLLRELAARAEVRRHLVLSGSASELERDLPFSVFVDALDEYLESLGALRFAGLDDDVQAELAQVFPSLSALGSGHEVALQHERYRAHRAVRMLLEHLAERIPVVIVLDDLQWADPASLELLDALLRRPPAAAVLLALALRPRRLPERFTAALDRAQRANVLERIELRELTAVEAREFLGGAVGLADAAALYEESGGNPFYLEQLARFDRGDGADSPAATSLIGIGVPPAVIAALSEELASLSDRSRLVLEGAAVAGDPFELELAAAAAAISEATAMDALDELLQLDVVRIGETPRRFRFRHPLVRRAVYESTSGAWRLGAHERCAEALAVRGAPPAARAHHVERSARDGDLGAVAVLREAGETAARLAPASAAGWFAAALRVLPQSAPAEERIELLLARARALTAGGHFADSHAALLEGLAIVPSESIGLRARLTKACAGIELLLGRQEEAYFRLADTLAALPEPDSAEAVALMIELALSAGNRTKYPGMQEWAERAVDAARLLPDPALTASAVAMLALADSLLGADARAEAERAEAAALVDALSDDALARRLDAAAWLAGAEVHLDRYAEADAHAQRALTLARITGQGEVFTTLYQILGRVWFVRGKLAEAGELLDGGIEAARLHGNTQALVWSLYNRSFVALAAGDVALALATAQESVDLSRELDAGFHSAWAAARLAAARLEAGDASGAADLLVRSAGGEKLAFIPGSWKAYCLELLTRCWLALDREAEARRAATDAEVWAATTRLPLPAAWAGRAAAAVDLVAGEPARAAERALASAAAADEVQAPIEAALSRTLAGRALARAGDRARAVAELQRAVAVFGACGAVRHRHEAERELRKLGEHIHQRTRPGNADGAGIETLTARELQVARLVVDRKTNPEIAAELFLSTKTVETHLRNIFRKLNVATRVALAHTVERAEREATPAR